MESLVGSVRRHLSSSSRNKSRSLPLYSKTESGSGSDYPDRPSIVGAYDDHVPGTFSSSLQRRISTSSPKLAWTSHKQGQEKRGQEPKRRNPTSCLGQQVGSDDSSSDTTSCSSLEFMPGSSLQPTLLGEQLNSQDQVESAAPKVMPVKRRDRLEAVKARVTARRNSYRDDSSSSSEGEQDLARVLGKELLPRFLSDEALHRPGRGRYSKKARRKSQNLEAMSRTQVTRSDPQLPFEDRYPLTWTESTAYQEPCRLQADDSPSQSTSEDIPLHCPVEEPVASSLLPPQAPTRNYLPGPPSARKPLTVSVHGIAGHFPPASPCDSGLGSHSMTSSPSLGRAPTPPLKSPISGMTAYRLPPSLISTPGSKSEPSTVAWLQKKQNLLSQMTPTKLDIASPRLVSQVCSGADHEQKPVVYLSDSQVENGRDHSHLVTQKLSTWKMHERSHSEVREENVKPQKVCSMSDTDDIVQRNARQLNGDGRIPVDVCRSQGASSTKHNSSPSWPMKDTPCKSSATVRAGTPDKAESTTGVERTSKSTLNSSRSWLPLVQPRNPNRISAAEALGVTPAIPPPPIRVGSLGNSRRRTNALTEKERRKRCSEYLDDALKELETIYQSLRLNDDDELLDRAERRDMPVWRPALGSRGSGFRQKRYSIADPTGVSFLDGSFRDHGVQMRRSAIPDKVADDLAVRKLQSRPSAPRRKFPLEAATSPSYLLFSPVHTPTMYVKPATRDVTSPNEPDPELDDVGYRKFSKSLRQPAPHPPFGIPLDPCSRSPASSYIYAESSETGRIPDWRSSKKKVLADPQRDDLAFRNLRRDSLRSEFRSSSALSEPEWSRLEAFQSSVDQKEDSMANIIAALEDLGRRSPPPVPQRRHFHSSGQKRLHGLTHRA